MQAFPHHPLVSRMLAFQDDYPEKRPRGSEPPLRFITAALWGDDLDPRRSARSSAAGSRASG